MKIPRSTNRSPRRGQAFTLMELLAVVTIIGVLAALVIGVAGYAQRKAAISRAQAEIAELSRAIEAYRLDFGQYPTSTSNRGSITDNNHQLYTQLVSQPGRYITFRPNQLRVTGTTTNILDPFGNPYNYFRTYPVTAAQTNRATFDLWSFGPDGFDETTSAAHPRDDITNWR